MSQATRTRRRVRMALAGLAVVLLPIAACGDDDDGGEGAEGAPTSAPETTEAEGEPQRGGTLTFAEYSEPAGLDPIVSTGAGVTGAIEMSAIYDTIMRWNPETGEYEPRTAESLESNEDFTVWTLKLKPGITFHDGTPYNAEAVVFGMMRHKSGQPGAPPCEEMFACPRNATSSGVYMSLVESMEVVDELTVRFTLTEPWTAFAYALSDEASMIPSPTAMRTMCANTPVARECPFNLAPVGAGPFRIDRFTPKESITMVRNENYWGGEVYLDGLRFVNPGDAGGDLTWEGFDAGNYDVAFLRTPPSVAAAEEAGVPHYSALQHGGGVFLVNMGVTITCAGGQPAPLCTGKPDGPTATTPPTASLKVRQAIAYAIDPVVIDERAYEGLGNPDSSLLQEEFRWDPGVEGPEYDPELARQLADEAKAEGWDGTVRILYTNAPTAQQIAIAVETMLEAVGIDAIVDTSKPTAEHIQTVVVQKDFDLSGWGYAIASDDGAMAALAQNLQSTSPSNRVGFKSEAVDQALRDLRAAQTDEEKVEAFRIIEQEVAEQIPVIPFAAMEERIVWHDNVHGIVFNHSTSMFFDKAWKS
ncbi:MAG TPA: ABC transporter substrate-binding protein [Acidimicrobiales bacterium]